MQEVWREIPGYGGWYEVSNLGRVRSHRAPRGRGTVPARRSAPCILKGHPVRGGYLMVTLRINNVRTHCLIHRLVAAAFIGPKPDGLDTCHNDGNPSNNVLTNLRYDTKLANQSDRLLHGTDCRGEKNPAVKLDADDVHDIRRRRLAGRTARSLAEEYGVHVCTIQRILNGSLWGWLVTPGL